MRRNAFQDLECFPVNYPPVMSALSQHLPRPASLIGPQLHVYNSIRLSIYLNSLSLSLRASALALKINVSFFLKPMIYEYLHRQEAVERPMGKSFTVDSQKPSLKQRSHVHLEVKEWYRNTNFLLILVSVWIFLRLPILICSITQHVTQVMNLTYIYTSDLINVVLA